MSGEHTPTPWEAEPETGAGRVWVRRARQPSTLTEYVAEPLFGMRAEKGGQRDYARREADAALIVRAVNAHDALVAVVFEWLETECPAIDCDGERGCCDARHDRARAALAKAGVAHVG